MPTEYKRTSRAPLTIEGVEFLSFRVGCNQYALYGANGRAIVKRNYNRATYKAIVDGATVGERFFKRNQRMQSGG